MLLLCAALLTNGRVTAQTLTTLYSFTNAAAIGESVLSGGTLYGTTASGGNSGKGAVFAICTNGTGFTNLHSFVGNDGATPVAGLILSGDTFYGTAEFGGSAGNGTIFRINTNGTGFTNLHSFAGNDGAGPVAGLILSDNTLYGTAAGGGLSGRGMVFSINTDGTGFTNLHSFTFNPQQTNIDGINPSGSLVLSGNILYGTAKGGGSSGNGTVFAINRIPTATTNVYGFVSFSYGFTNLNSFTKTFSSTSFPTNNDGANPAAGLVYSSNTLYGVTQQGGTGGCGTVFAINTDGTGFTNLHNFPALIPNANAPYNSDGAFPEYKLVVSGNTLFGTASDGGFGSQGTVFSLNTDGTRFMTQHNFALDLSEGNYPDSVLILSGHTLYGTTKQGGSHGNGTMFSISFAPQLAITPLETNVIVTWPTNVAGFDYSEFILQSTTNPAPPTIWTAVSPAAVIVNGQNTVTNPVLGNQRFYRLGQ